MRTSTVALGSTAFFVMAPGTVVGVIPWLITHWQFREPLPYWLIAQMACGPQAAALSGSNWWASQWAGLASGDRVGGP